MDYKQLIEEYSTPFPKEGDVLKGKVLSIGHNEVKLDVEGLKTGVVRGKELYHEASEYANLSVGDEIEATVLEFENENGDMELSFRFAGHQKAWDRLLELKQKGEVVKARIYDANKGGLMIKVDHIVGFLPVSQLIPEHYPRVQGGDKNKILERLKTYIGQDFDVKLIDVDAKDEKLIVSEKGAWEERQQQIISEYKEGSVVEGIVTAITDFGVFVEFGNNLEGLVHISELAWQRIDDPRDVIAVGQKIKAEIIKIDRSKIFLSMKKLVTDPWINVQEKYKVGSSVKGKVLKCNPFGLFVELDKDIHGLAHISELSNKQIDDPCEFAKPGQILDFIILSIEPENHRLGLSIKALDENKAGKKSKKEPKEKEAGEPVAEEAKTEAVEHKEEVENKEATTEK